jgi:hypothetical protein
MDTLPFPIEKTKISLSANAFALEVKVAGVVKYTITKHTGIVGISTDLENVFLTIPGTEFLLSTTMIWDNIRSFNIQHDPEATCVEDGIGVVDFRDLRKTYWWCISTCPISLQLTEEVVPGSSIKVPVIIVWRSSDAEACYTETTTIIP